MKNKELFKRRGEIRVSKDYMLQSNSEELKAIFSNFYPIGIDICNKNNFYDYIVYFGVSPLFDEVEEYQAMPRYDIVLHREENGEVKLEEFKRV